jgi:hypothetical protein
VSVARKFSNRFRAGGVLRIEMERHCMLTFETSKLSNGLCLIYTALFLAGCATKYDDARTELLDEKPRILLSDPSKLASSEICTVMEMTDDKKIWTDTPESFLVEARTRRICRPIRSQFLDGIKPDCTDEWERRIPPMMGEQSVTKYKSQKSGEECRDNALKKIGNELGSTKCTPIYIEIPYTVKKTVDLNARQRELQIGQCMSRALANWSRGKNISITQQEADVSYEASRQGGGLLSKENNLMKKLNELKKAKADGLISNEEYDKMRQAVIDGYN